MKKNWHFARVPRVPSSPYLSPLSRQTRKTLLKTTPTGRQPVRLTLPNSCPPKPLPPTPQPPPSLNYPPKATHIAARLLRLPLMHPRSNITLLVISIFHLSSFCSSVLKKKILNFLKEWIPNKILIWLDCETTFRCGTMKVKLLMQSCSTPHLKDSFSQM